MGPKPAGPAVKGDAAGAGGSLKGKKPAVNGQAAEREPLRERGGGDRGSGFVHISGKPDKEAHEQEIKAYDDEIARLRVKFDDLRKKLGTGDTKESPANARREELRNQLNALRSEQATIKTSRQSILNQIKSLNDGIASKVAALKASREKSRFRSVAEIDAEIKRLEKQVESGQMRLVDEKKALNEMSNLRKARKTVEGFGTQDEAIQADKRQIDDLRKQLDAPESKAAADRYDALRKELDDLNSQNDAQRTSRQKIYSERDALKSKIDAVYEQRREAKQNFRDASDKHHQKVMEEKRKRQEKDRSERLAWEKAKREEENERILEQAKQPAFQREIEDCRNLIVFFTKDIGAASVVSTDAVVASNLPQLNLRKIDEDGQPPLGAALKKKGEDEEAFFVGKAGKRKGRGGTAAAPTSAAKQSFNMPLPYLSALLALGIPAPSSASDSAQTVEALTEKRKWYESHQDAETKKRIAEAEKRIAANEKKSREPETDADRAATIPIQKPALTTRLSEEADVPKAPVEAPGLLVEGGEAVTSTNAAAEPLTEAELSAATEQTT